MPLWLVVHVQRILGISCRPTPEGADWIPTEQARGGRGSDNTKRRTVPGRRDQSDGGSTRISYRDRLPLLEGLKETVARLNPVTDESFFDVIGAA